MYSLLNADTVQLAIRKIKVAACSSRLSKREAALSERDQG